MRYLFLAAMLALGGTSAMAYGQAVNTPQNTSPGAIIQYNTRPWAIPDGPRNESGDPSNQAPDREKPASPAPVELERQPTEKPLPSPLLIQVKAIRVEGATLISARQIEETVKPFRNRELSFEEIQTLADKLTGLYIQDGYINSQVYIPPQTLKDQTLVLKALETRIGEIRMENARWFRQSAVLRQLPIQSGKPFNIKPLSTGIRRLNDNPDLQLQARLQKGKTPGTTDIVLHAVDHFPIHVTPFWDNLGRRNIGNLRYGLTLANHNALGFGDNNVTSLNLSKSSFGLINQYSLPLGSHGTQLGFDYAYSKVKLGGSLKPLDIQSSAKIFSPAIRQNLLKTDRAGLDAEIALDFKNLNTNLLGEPFHRDRLRVLRPSLSGYFNDRRGRTYFNQEFGIGLNMLGGSIGNTSLASKAGSGTRFFRMNGGVTRIQKMPWHTTGVLRSHYQYSPDRLVSAEQIQLGGAFSVRGYQEGRMIGDKGYALSAEWYVPAFILPAHARLPFNKIPLREAVQVVGFTDFGQIYINRPISGETRKSALLGCGVGLRIQLGRFLVGRVDVGFPLIRQAPYENRARLHFGLQSSVF